MEMRSSASRGRLVLGAALVALGVLALALGVVYLTVPAGKLPTFLPGHVAGATLHRPRRGIAGLLVGGILFVLGAVTLLRGRR